MNTGTRTQLATRRARYRASAVVDYVKTIDRVAARFLWWGRTLERPGPGVQLAVGVASGGISYGGNLGTNASFKRLQSAVLNIQLGAGVAYTLQTSTSQVGAIYSGLVVGVITGGNVVKPLAEHWPDASGAFSMRLPASIRGKTVRLWENQRQFFSHFAARPGGAVDLASWPSQLGNSVPAGLAALPIPRK